MATKNLARTLIEGGRAGYNKRERRQSHGDERALVRSYLARVRGEHDGFDAHALEPRGRVLKDFDDRLAAPRRWLRSHVGRPWDKVRSEMFERFDPRTLAGRHIIFCHLLKEVRRWDDPKPLYRSDRFLIDRYGILRVIDHGPRKKRCTGHGIAERTVLAWTNDRRVGGRGDALYWYLPVRTCSGCTRERCCCPLVGGKHRHQEHSHYRQDTRLDERDLAFWRRLCGHDRVRFAVPNWEALP